MSRPRPTSRKLVRAAHEYPLIREYSTRTAPRCMPPARPLSYGNTNGLVRSKHWDIELSKTGYISEAGRCLVMHVRLAEKDLIVVLLDSWGKHSRIGDANRIRKWLESGAVARPLELAELPRRRRRGTFGSAEVLPPKYFYDAAGSRLFARICRLPEYYLTRAELALTRRHLAAIARFAGRGCQLIEYGSGEGIKSRLLIRALRPAVYVPIDISRGRAATRPRAASRASFPGCASRRCVGDFSRPLDIPVRRGTPSVVYFPGSTIGNLTPRGGARLPLHVARRSRRACWSAST